LLTELSDVCSTNSKIVLRVFRYAARFLSGILDYKVMIDSYVFLSLFKAINFAHGRLFSTDTLSFAVYRV